MVALITALAPSMAGTTTLFGISLTTAAGGLTLAGTLVNLAGSTLLSSAARALSRPRGSQQVLRDLAMPQALPSKRFVYGQTRAVGTPIALRVVGEYLYACWLFNSRESEGEFDLILDKRRVTLSGDPYDFAGAGGAATNDQFTDHLTVWFGRGDQTQPPATILADAPWAVADPQLFRDSDAGRGCTVVWAKIRAGGSGQRQERWPNSPPYAELEGKFSKVWDPRDGAQDADDAATWTWSDNHRLCVLDALRQNPVRPYQLRNLNLTQWQDAADAADQLVSLKSGGTEKRYRARGTLVFSGAELEDLLAPMMAAGAADFVRTGGRLGITTGIWDGVAYTLHDLLDYMTCSSLKRGEDLPTQIRASYVSAAREYEAAELPAWDIPGAQAADGGVPAVVTYDLEWAGSPTQAQRCRKILGLKARSQRSLSGIAPPSAFTCVSGSVVQVSLPAPFNSRDGTYEVVSIHPALDPVGTSGVALRCPIELTETSAAIYAWDAATDEIDIEDPVYDASRPGVQMPGAISVTSGPGVDLDNGGSLVPRMRFAFAPSGSSGVEGYEWQWRVAGGAYQSGGVIDPEAVDGGGDAYGFLNLSSVSAAHDIRIRTTAAAGQSGWREITGVFYNMALTGLTITEGLGHAAFAATAPENEVFRGVRVYRSTGTDFDAAVMVMGLEEIEPGAAFTVYAGDETTTNLITDPGFDDALAWDTIEGGWSVSGGSASHVSGTFDLLLQNHTLTAGASYRFAYEVTAISAGHVRSVIDGSPDAQGVAQSSTGRVVETVVAGASPVAVGLQGSDAFVGSVDDLIVFEQTAGHLTQGTANFWIVPVSTTGAEGLPDGPHELTII